MIQLFQLGEVAILQSTDAPQNLWNAHVTITAVQWIENPLDIHGMPMASTYVYEVNICDKRFEQATLRKITPTSVEIKEKVAEPCFR